MKALTVRSSEQKEIEGYFDSRTSFVCPFPVVGFDRRHYEIVGTGSEPFRALSAEVDEI